MKRKECEEWQKNEAKKRRQYVCVFEYSEGFSPQSVLRVEADERGKCRECKEENKPLLKIVGDVDREPKECSECDVSVDFERIKLEAEMFCTDCMRKQLLEIDEKVKE